MIDTPIEINEYIEARNKLVPDALRIADALLKRFREDFPDASKDERDMWHSKFYHSAMDTMAYDTGVTEVPPAVPICEWEATF